MRWAAVHQQSYDALDRLHSQLGDTKGIKAAIQIEHNRHDEPTAVTDPKALITQYAYNEHGDLAQLDSPDTGTVDDPDRCQLATSTQRTDARGQLSTYRYDALDRLAGITDTGEGTRTVSFEYDTPDAACAAEEQSAIGHLSRMTDPSGSTVYCYDRQGRLTRKQQTTRGVTLTVRYAYTTAGRLKAITYPDSTQIAYAYDAQGRVNAVTMTDANGTPQSLLSGVSYAPFGGITQWQYGNGRTLQRRYDTNGRPIAIDDGAANGLSLGFSYDKAGQLVSLRGADEQSPLERQYSYDGLGRLNANQRRQRNRHAGVHLRRHR